MDLDSILKFEADTTLWCFKVALTFFLSTSIGWFLVQQLGQLAGKTDKIWKLTIPLLITPIIIFVVLRVTSKYFHSCDGVVADSFAFGVVAGIIIKLSLNKKPTNNSIRLIVFSSNGKQVEVMIDSPNELVGDVRNKIADAFRIHPSNRVLIETGKGGFVQDLSSPLLYSINSNLSLNSVDFFGLKTIVCYVHIKEEEDEKGPSEKVKSELTRHGSISRGVLNLLKSKAVVRCNESYYLTGKIATSNDIGKSFCVQMVDKFVAATLSNQHGPPIRLQKWNKSEVAASEKNGDSNASEPGNGTEDESDHNIPKLSKLESFTNMLKRSSVGKEEGEPIHNGDFVVLECDGK